MGAASKGKADLTVMTQIGIEDATMAETTVTIVGIAADIIKVVIDGVATVAPRSLREE